MTLLYNDAGFEGDKAVVLLVDEAEIIGSVGLSFEHVTIGKERTTLVHNHCIVLKDSKD